MRKTICSFLSLITYHLSLGESHERERCYQGDAPTAGGGGRGDEEGHVRRQGGRACEVEGARDSERVSPTRKAKGKRRRQRTARLSSTVDDERQRASQQ